MKYGKLTNGVIEYAPYHLVKNGTDIIGYNFESNIDMMLADGYKPVELIADKSKYSDCEGEYVYEFEEKSDKIVEVAKYNRYSDDILNEKVRQNRLNAYQNNTDQLTLRKLRKQALGTWTDEDETEYVETIKKMSYDIDVGNPYVNGGGCKE